MQMASNNGSVLCRRKRIDGFGDDVAPVHVLAVDDSFVDRKVIERLLKISSCTVTAVDSGRRALQYLGLDEEKSPLNFDGLKVDMIITDYCMPGMTGYELLKKVKGSANLKEIPVVIMSSENVLARIDRCLEEGAEDFIVKPVKLSDVKRLKDHMLGEENKDINKRKEQEPSDLRFPSQPSIVSSCSSTCSFTLDTSSQSSSSPLSPESSPLLSPSPISDYQQSDSESDQL